MMISHAQITGAALEAAGAEALARGLALDQPASGIASLGASPVLRVLGQSGFVEFTAVNVPGKVVWCNFDLAREAGFDVPPSNRLTARFHDQLIEALSFRALRPNEEAGERRQITMYADKYWGVWPFLGGARAGFLPYGNFYIKGLGLTPAFKPSPDDEFVHSHGGLTLEEAIIEAIIGEVNTNLFTHGSARMLAIIDLGEQIVFPDGSKYTAVLGVRAGSQLRPAHLLAHPLQRNGRLLDRFVRMTRETGQLVAHEHPVYGTETLDIKQTLLRIIDDHALTASQQFRWRMLHGAISSSNMELNGAMLDVITQTSQPRTAPIWMLKGHADSVFGREHVERSNELWHIFRALIKDIAPARRAALNARPLKLHLAMEKAYQRHLEIELLAATGIKRALAQQIRSEHADLARRFTNALLEMSRIKNPGCTNANLVSCEDVSVLDVFHLLQHFPRAYFAEPDADHTEIIRTLLAPIFKGNRYHIAKRRAKVEALIGEFAGAYHELMTRCITLANTHYEDVEAMKASVIARAGFENELVAPLYRSHSFKALEQLTATCRASGDAARLQDESERWVALSLRSVEQLIAQAGWRDGGNGYFLATRMLGGMTYRLSLRAAASRQPRLLISVPCERERDRYVTPLAEISGLTRTQIRQLRYRFSFDGWASAEAVRARLIEDEYGHLIIRFDEIGNLPVVGRLEGYVTIQSQTKDHSEHEATPTLRCYPFAIPDRLELAALTTDLEPSADARADARLFYVAT
jgi:hypothetical protein